MLLMQQLIIIEMAFLAGRYQIVIRTICRVVIEMRDGEHDPKELETVKRHRVGPLVNVRDGVEHFHKLAVRIAITDGAVLHAAPFTALARSLADAQADRLPIVGVEFTLHRHNPIRFELSGQKSGTPPSVSMSAMRCET